MNDFQKAKEFGQKQPSSPRADFACRIAAFAVWGAFVVFCIGLATSMGFYVADDAGHAAIAKSVACGAGFVSVANSPDREPYEPPRFDPEVGTGPAVILPCAALLKIAGNSSALPGISVVLLWGSVLTFVLVRLGREMTGFTLLLATLVFCLTVILVFARNLFQWHSLLGEVPALAYLLAGHCLIATERASRRVSLLAGLFLGLAVQSKYLAALPCAGAFVILAVRLAADRPGWKMTFFRAAAFLLGCVAPTALWESCKLASLGSAGYVLNWRQFHWAMGAYTIRNPEPFSLALLWARFVKMNNEFGVNLFAWTIMAVTVVSMFRMRVWRKWPCLFLGLVVSSACSIVYWLCFSMGWPRYAVMGVGMACFALVVPIFGLPRVRQKLLFALLALIVLSPTIGLLPELRVSVKSGLFQPNFKRKALTHVAAAIEDLRRQGPVDLLTRYFAEYWEVDFAINGCANFNRKLPADETPAPSRPPYRKIVLINKLWGASSRAGREVDERADVESVFEAKITAVLFSEFPYELVEIKDLPPAHVVSAQRPAGAFISASPNPVPAGMKFGVSEIAWNTGDGEPGRVVLAVRGYPEQPVSNERRGTRLADWLTPGNAYEFRLYGGKDQRTLFGKVRVTRNAQ